MSTGSQLRSVLSKRREVLESFLEESRTKPELVEELDRSRSTIDRAVAELLDVDCIEPVEKAGSEFRITPTGTVAVQTYREYRDDTATIQSNASLLNVLPASADLGRTFLSEADVRSSKKTPDVAHQPAVELLPEATKLTGTAPVVFGEYFDILIEWIRDGDSEMELVLERDLLESIEENYESEFAALSDLDSIELRVLDEQLPYAIWLLEHGSGVRAGITIYEDGGLKGSLVTDSDRAVEWARETYERYEECSSRLV